MTLADLDVSLSDKSSFDSGLDPLALKVIVKDILNELQWHEIPDTVCELSLLITSDSHIRELNRDFRGKDKATDVLSFSQIEGDELGPGPFSLGDIVISLDTTVRQAAELKHSLGEELLRLLIHGILHLLGYDHENVPEDEVKRMQDLEDRLFQTFLDRARLLFNCSSSGV